MFHCKDQYKCPSVLFVLFQTFAFFFCHQVFYVDTFRTASLFSLSYDIGPRTKDRPNGSFYIFFIPYYYLMSNLNLWHFNPLIQNKPSPLLWRSTFLKSQWKINMSLFFLVTNRVLRYVYNVYKMYLHDRHIFYICITLNCLMSWSL